MSDVEKLPAASEIDESVVTPSKRKRNLILATLLFVAIAIGFVAMYLLVWQHEETTDDAYVAGHVVQITPRVGGNVRKVLVEDTSVVKKGDVLVELDDSDYRLAFERAQSELIQAIRQNKQQIAAVSQSRAEVVARRTALAQAQQTYKRLQSLSGTDAVSAEEISRAQTAVKQAEAAVKAVEAAEVAARAATGNRAPLLDQPSVRIAISHIKDAWLSMQRTQIRAPMDGQIAKRVVQVGQQVGPGVPMMALVPLHDLWVDANFKETQLHKMRVGQPVILESDLYGSKVEYHGKVVGVSAGTGSAFSVLPAQNATGNWIKVVQRVPVRVSLNPEDLKKYPLRIGLSMSAHVDTSQSGEGDSVTAVPAVQTANMPEVAEVDWTPVNRLIDDLIEQYGK